MTPMYDSLLGSIREQDTTSSGSTNFKGYFADEAALTAAYPTAEAGDYAIVGSTDTVWVWDTDSSAWVNSGSSPATWDAITGKPSWVISGTSDYIVDKANSNTSSIITVSGAVSAVSATVGSHTTLIDNLTGVVSGKADSAHTHAMSDVSGLLTVSGVVDGHTSSIANLSATIGVISAGLSGIIGE